MVHIQQHNIAQISGPIHGVAGYYSEDGHDKTQHVVAGTKDGKLYEMHWNQHTLATSPQALKRSPGSGPVQFNGIHSLSGFYTSDDKFQHVIVATEDGQLHEVYFNDPQNVRVRSPLFQLPIAAGHHIGQAGFDDSCDKLRDVTVGGANKVLYEVSWNKQVNPSVINQLDQFTLLEVVAIAGFYDLSLLSGPGSAHFVSKNIIVATKGGEVYDARSEGTCPGGGSDTIDLVTTFPSPLVNVAAFVDTDTHCRHVIALHANGQLYDYSYTPQQVFGQTTLLRIPNVVDIVAYYSAYDTTCHVIAATSDREIVEVYYS